jgi:hypothetical protein
LRAGGRAVAAHVDRLDHDAVGGPALGDGVRDQVALAVTACRLHAPQHAAAQQPRADRLRVARADGGRVALDHRGDGPALGVAGRAVRGARRRRRGCRRRRRARALARRLVLAASGQSHDQQRRQQPSHDRNSADSDHDGLTDAEELELGTNPRSNDTDGDGLLDAEELELGTNPRSNDTDGDGLPDGEELDRDTDPFGEDTDGDGDPDGEDGDPLAYDGGIDDAVKGAVCGGGTALFCPDDDDAVRATDEYVLGEILTGLFAVGDVRDAIGALIDGKLGEAFWAAVGIVPVAGDTVKIGRKVRAVIAKFPARRGQLLGLLIKLFPDGSLKRAALDAATDGGYSALRNAGLSDEAVEQLARRGNDLRKLADTARVGARTLDPADARRLEDAVAQNWPPARRAEGYGVESALAELRRDPNIEVVYDGRPRPGMPVNGPDIVAVDRRTGRPIVIEAKGTLSARPLGRRSLRSTAGGRPVTQTSPDWLRTNPDRYLRALRSSPDPNDRRAADLLEDLIDNNAPYDVRIYNSRPAGQGGYGSGVDTVVDDVRAGGQVQDVQIVDVQRPRVGGGG